MELAPFAEKGLLPPKEVAYWRAPALGCRGPNTGVPNEVELITIER